MDSQNIKTFEPYLYKSRIKYEMRYKSIDFWFSTGGFILGFTLIIFPVILNLLALNGIIKGSYISLAFVCSLFAFASILYSVIISGGFGEYVIEIVERINMRDKNYQPLVNTVRVELNYLVQLSNGQLFRQYQFINAGKSGANYIVVEVPKDAKIINEANTSKKDREILNNTCMFNRRDELELLSIITPITKYHEDKAYRDKIKEQEKFTKNQSKLNASITNKDINNLPLFKSLKELQNKTDQEVQQCNEDTKKILKENQKIIS